MPTIRALIRASKHLSYGDTSTARRHRHQLRAAVGAFRSARGRLAAILRGCSWATLSEEVVAFIENYVPRIDSKTWERIGPFVRDSVSVAAPLTAYSAEVLIRPASHHVAWCLKQGWALDAETIWSRQAINLYVNDKRLKLDEGTRRNYRACLMRISEVLLPQEHGEKMTALNRKTTAEPYSDIQMAGFRGWATAQLTPFKRYRAMLMLILCAGAGLRANEIAELKLSDIEQVHGRGFVIHLDGENPRSIPLLAEWDEWMEAVLERIPEEHDTLWGKPNRTSRNSVLSSFTQYTVGDAPVGARLRATWFRVHLSAMPIKALFRAAGFDKFEHLGRLLHYVEDETDEEYVRFLRGERNS